MAGELHLPESERARRVRRWIRRGEKRLRARHPVLNHPDAIAAVSTVIPVAGMVGLGWLYALGHVSAMVCILGNAFLASILHEIEHDLIHHLYFQARPVARNLALLLAWAFRGNVVHGWYRRRIHLHHHKASGTLTDVEERLLGLGQPWGPRRILVMVDGAMAFLLNARVLQDEAPGFRRRELALASVPVYPVFAFVLLSFLAAQGLRLFVPGYVPSPLFAALYPTIDVLAVSWVFPNYLRQAALQIVSSNVHYYGDVDAVHTETQIPPAARALAVAAVLLQLRNHPQLPSLRRRAAVLFAAAPLSMGPSRDAQVRGSVQRPGDVSPGEPIPRRRLIGCRLIARQRRASGGHVPRDRSGREARYR